VEKNDTWTVIYAGGALLSAAAGTWLFLRKEKNDPGSETAEKKQLLNVGTVGFSGIMINYIYRF